MKTASCTGKLSAEDSSHRIAVASELAPFFRRATAKISGLASTPIKEDWDDWNSNWRERC